MEGFALTAGSTLVRDAAPSPIGPFSLRGLRYVRIVAVSAVSRPKLGY
jgi:hypothetical protein